VVEGIITAVELEAVKLKPPSVLPVAHVGEPYEPVSKFPVFPFPELSVAVEPEASSNLNQRI
jgi:hypothetical protein